VGQYKVKTNDADVGLSIKMNNFPPHLLTQPEPVGFMMSAFTLLDYYTGWPLLAPFIPAQNNPANMVIACVHRFGTEMKPTTTPQCKDFFRYAKHFIVTHFAKVHQADIPSFGEWLERTKYKQPRKDQLKAARGKLTILTRKSLSSKSFIKWEGYTKAKHARGINSPDDESKVVLGPLFKAIDEATFHSKWFVKHTIPKEWPAKMKALFGDHPVMETDYSSFEAHHRGMFSEIVHFWAMNALRECGIPNNTKRFISKMIMGTNVTKFKYLTAKIRQRLMSGVVYTSSANAVLNLITTSYLNGRTVYPTRSPEELAESVDEFFVGLVEGDDGICIDRKIDPALIEKLGLVLKFETAPNFGQASFCGVVCDPEEMTIVSDPLKFLQNFFMLAIKYKALREGKQRALLRAKALSYKYNLNDCPIIGELCHRVCDLTSGIDISWAMSETDPWKADYTVLAAKEQLWKKRPEPTARARKQVEIHFGISVAEQLAMEAQIRQSDGCFRLELHPHCDAQRIEHARAMMSREGVPPLVWGRRDVVDQILANGKEGEADYLVPMVAKYDRLTTGRAVEFEPLAY